MEIDRASPSELVSHVPADRLISHVTTSQSLEARLRRASVKRLIYRRAQPGRLRLKG